MRKIIFILLSITFFTSCNKSNIYTNYFDFEDDIWHADSSIVFKFISEKNNNMSFKLSISYSNQYPYQNIYTSYSLLDSSKNILKSEMIEYQLFEKKYGYPLGSGIYKDFVLDSLIIDNLVLNKDSEYTFLVKHSMRENFIIGVSRLALEIDKN